MEIEEFLNLENPHEYDFTKEMTEKPAYKELVDLERFFYWSKTKLEDPDSKCELLRKIYKKLWDEKYWVNCEEDNGVHCKEEDRIILGDTMNSVNTTLDEYVKFYVCGDEKNAKITECERKRIECERTKYEEIKHKNRYQKISINYLTKRFDDKDGNLNKFLSNNKNLIKFMNVYHTLGNFIPFPKGCNGPRGRGATKDYWDLALKYIHEYYSADDDKEKSAAIKEIIKNDELQGNMEKWLDDKSGFGDWDTFIEKIIFHLLLMNQKSPEKSKVNRKSFGMVILMVRYIRNVPNNLKNSLNTHLNGS